jgi:hypothetical protein
MNPESTEAKCPFNHEAPVPNSTPVPPRIAKLPVLRGFHVPAFVEKVNGEYDFRIMSRDHLIACVKRSLCWVCGEPLGRFKTFVIGPMCGITRTSAEPPSHHECAVYSAMACPFLTRPNMKRRDHENLKKITDSAGEMIDRNPGVSAVWTCVKFDRFRDERGGVLFKVGEPEKVEWYREGRLATRDEVIASIVSGTPILRSICDQESTPERCAESHRQMDGMVAVLEQYLPTE